MSDNGCLRKIEIGLDQLSSLQLKLMIKTYRERK